MKHRIRLIALSALSVAMVATLAVSLPAPAYAGAVDSPLPNLGAGTTTIVFYVPGVVKNNALETVFMCSNLDVAEVRVAVELFGGDGVGPINDVTTGDGLVILGVGTAAAIVTGSTAGFSEDEIINAATLIRAGTARVVATSPRIACTAMVTHDATQPPASVYSLQVVGRNKLQAGN